MSIKKLFIYFFKEKIHSFGLSIVKNNFLDFDQNFDISKLNLSKVNIIKSYNLQNIITTAGKQLGSIEDPYYYALKESLPLIEKKIFINSFVKNIKLIIKSSRTAAEAIGLDDSKILSKYPEWALVKPWEEKLIDKIHETYLLKFISKRKKLKSYYENFKIKKKEVIYSDLAWESHAEQFFDLYISMSKNGFKNINPIPVHLFKYNNSFKVSLSDDGNHRIRVAYVLGLKSVPLKISKIVDLENINNWVNVKNGLYSLEEAKKIFINYFNYSGKGAYV